MKGGKFIHKRFNFLSLGSALSWNAARDKIVASQNVLSMFKMEWLFPLHVGGLPIPFYPFPFRTKRGGILFPNSGSGWYMRDEVLGALDWIKKFWPTDKIRNADKCVILKFHECYEFHPANDLVPYKFVPDLYEQRRAVKSADPDDPLQMNIKLVINSLYGKTAQNVSGEEGAPPASACPWYAAAITAYCRMRALKAALHAPHDIIMFCTDGIMSTSELKDLPDVIEVDDDGTPKDPAKQQKLGDWEFNRLKGGGFLVSGVYYLDQYNGKTKDRSRGTRPSNFVSKMSMKDFFHNIVLPAWRKGLLTPTEDIKAQIRLNQYISIGAATASRERFKIAGRWGEVTREVSIHSLGLKRYQTSDMFEFDKYFAGVEPLRCRDLIPTFPAHNKDKEGNPSFEMSAQAKVGWLENPDDVTEEAVWKEFFDSETNDLLLGFE